MDPDRIFQGKRVLHFTAPTRAGSPASRSGSGRTTWPTARFRLGCVFCKPTCQQQLHQAAAATASDGVYIHVREVFTPIVGYNGYEYITDFFEIPDGEQHSPGTGVLR